MMKKVDVLFLYETRVRELENICLVKNELESRGYTVGVQNTWNSLGIQKYPFKAKVVVTHGMYHDGIYHFVKSLVGSVPKIVNMQWEQVGVIDEDKNEKSRFLLAGVAGQSMNICWGDVTCERLRSRCKFEERNLRKTGQIALDFCRPEFRKYYLDKEKVCERYGIPKDLKLNLFISSFAYVNLPESQAKDCDADSKTDFIQFSRASFVHVTQWFERMMEKYPDQVLVYRPHPAEADNAELLKLSEKFKGRFFVISELSVKQWVAVSDKVYTWYSTASAEVHAFKVPFAILRPVEIPPHLEVAIFEDAKFVTSYEEFEETIRGELASPISEEVFDRLYFTDKEFAFVKVANAIEDVLRDDSYLIRMEEPRRSLSVKMKMLVGKALTAIKACLPEKSKMLEKYRKKEVDEYTLKLQKNNYASEEDVKNIQNKLKEILDR